MDPEMPKSSDWDWTKETTWWQPLWTTLLEASKIVLRINPLRARKHALDAASTTKLHLAALHCASALETVTNLISLSRCTVNNRWSAGSC